MKLSWTLYGILLGMMVLLPILFGKQIGSYVNSWIWPAIPVLPKTAVAGGLEFDGKDDFVSIEAVDWSYPQFTIEAFVTSATDSDNGTIVQLGSDGEKAELMSLYDDHQADSGKRLSGAAIQGKTPFANTSAPLTAGVRQHRVLVFDGRYMHYYVNGIWQAKRFAEAHEGLMWKMKNLRIGCDGSERRFFQGRIDQVRISHIARYDDNFALITSLTSDDSTLALYNFDEGAGEVLKDASGNGHDGKIVGATWVAAVPSSAGLRFSHTNDRVELRGLPLSGKAPFSIEAWATRDPSPVAEGRGWNVMKVSPRLGLRFHRPSMGWQFGASHKDGSCWALACQAPQWNQAGQRDHVVGQWTGTELQLFVNGQQIKGAYNSNLETESEQSKLIESSLADSFLDAVLIGGDLFPSTDHTYRGGVIDALRISHGVRYPVDFTPGPLTSDANTIALYDFAQGSGDVLKDISGNGHDGKIIGAKWVKAKSEDSTANSNSPPSESSDSRSQISNSTTGWHGWPSDAPAPAIAPFNAEQAAQHQEAWAKYLNVPVEYTNSIGMKFVLIPPGEFLMGAPQKDIDEMVAGNVPPNEVWENVIRSQGPQHRVILTQPFYAGIHEVTQEQFQRVTGERNQATQSEKTPDTNEPQNFNHPERTATWGDAIQFAVQLSQLEQLPASYLGAGINWIPQEGSGYRLPTEAQWEFAGRAGTTTRYWSGPGKQHLLAVDWVGENSGNSTHAVGEKPANPFGLFDIHGNAIEWTENEFDPTDYQKFQDTPAIDPRRLKNPGWTTFVARGGASDGWGELAFSSAFRLPRGFGNPPIISETGGCRLVLSVEAVRTLSKLTGPQAAAPSAASDASSPVSSEWLDRVSKLSPEEQVTEFTAEMKRRNPEWDGVVTPTITDGQVVGITFDSLHVKDLSPIAAFGSLRELIAMSSKPNQELSDLTPLAQLKLLGDVRFRRCENIVDLEPLRNLPIWRLFLIGSNVSDMSPLAGKPIQELQVDYCQHLKDVAPLRGAPLAFHLGLAHTGVTDLTPLRDAKVTSFGYDAGRLDSNWETIMAWPLRDFTCFEAIPAATLSKLQEISSLKRIDLMPLEEYLKKL